MSIEILVAASFSHFSSLVERLFDGDVGDWQLVHLGSRAIGGAGLVITEMTDVEADGRITPGCAGLYERRHVAAWKRIVDFVHQNSPAKIGIQLAHAGRKGSVCHPWDRLDDTPLTPEEGAWQTLAPSALPFASHWPPTKAMDRQDMHDRFDFNGYGQHPGNEALGKMVMPVFTTICAKSIALIPIATSRP